MITYQKLGYFEVACCGQKIQFAMVWHSEVLATLHGNTSFCKVLLAWPFAECCKGVLINRAYSGGDGQVRRGSKFF